MSILLGVGYSMKLEMRFVNPFSDNWRNILSILFAVSDFSNHLSWCFYDSWPNRIYRQMIAYGIRRKHNRKQSPHLFLYLSQQSIRLDSWNQHSDRRNGLWPLLFLILPWRSGKAKNPGQFGYQHDPSPSSNSLFGFWEQSRHRIQKPIRQPVCRLLPQHQVRELAIQTTLLSLNANDG